MMLVGLALRLAEGGRTYLNPDEIQNFFLSLARGFRALYVGTPLQIDHPPLLFVLLHPIALISSSEIALRLIPVLAGTVFPWVVYRWLARAWNAGAGFAAFAILTFSPDLIALSAQIRGYTLELLFAALALLFLETALTGRSLSAMLLFSVALDLAILSEYSAAWFAAAVGVYFLLRVAADRISPKLLVAWLFGQGTALALYWNLYRNAIQPRLAVRSGGLDAYLSGAFPAPHQNLLAFSALGMLKQFAYTFSSVSLGIGAFALFIGGLLLAWRRLDTSDPARGRSLAALLITPFVFACAGAILRLHPYARTRHTVILSLFVAAGTSIALERIFRARRKAAAWAAIALGSFWIFAATPDQNNIPRDRDLRASMVAGVAYLRSLPPGTLVLADLETARLIRFYLPDQGDLRPQPDFDNPDGPAAGPLRVVWRRWDFGSAADFQTDLASVRSHFGLSRSAPVWIVDGGFDQGIDARIRERWKVTLPEFHDFDGALTVFQTPPGL